MANDEHVDLVLQGAEAVHEWQAHHEGHSLDLAQARLRGVRLDGVDLRNADLSAADLGAASLRRSDLCGARLKNAHMSLCDLWRAKLDQAELTRATLWNANLRHAWLRGASLNWARLGGANLSDADLTGADLGSADLRCARLDQATMVNTVIDSAIVGQTVWATDLSEVQGLETLVHSGPSEIGQQALSLARGQLPDEFLKRCGLSDWQLLNARLYDPTLSAEAISDLQYRVFDLRVGQPLQVSSLFISYSHADSRFVTKLERVLDSQGIRYWRDVHHATAGRLDKVVERAIRLQDVTLLVLSESSVESDWVQHEVRVARAREKEEKRDLLCPIALDESWKSADWDPVIMDQVKRYNILSFQDWEDDVGFRDTYERLKAGWSIFY